VLSSLTPAALRTNSRLALYSDLTRATRGMIAFLGPLLVAQFNNAPTEFAFAAIAAQNIAFFEVRGDYRLRLAVLGCALLILTSAATIGASFGDNFLLAFVGAGLAAVAMGVWRHLNADYGPPLAISSMILYLIAQETSPAFSADHVATVAWWTLGGSVWGIVVQTVPWLFRPQQPLRDAVAECWTATAEFFESYLPSEETDTTRHPFVMEKEAALRTTLDRTYATLALAHTRRAKAFVNRLDLMAQVAARFSMRVGALHTALESTAVKTGKTPLTPAFRPILVSLTNNARTIALALISRQPAHLALTEVRLRRLRHLLDGFDKRLDAQSADEAHLSDAIARVKEVLTEIETALRATIDRAAERAAFSLELTDTETWSLRPLGASLNFSRHIDPVLLRFTIRVTILTLIGLGIAHALKLPHGYWLPFTMIVVLQPDYGSTRSRAAQRVTGTLLGSLLAVGLLALALPQGVLFAIMTVSLFAFGFFMKRDYSIGVLFVTIFVVLLTGLHQPVTASLAWERLASNALGGILALAGALLFWPVWERRRFPPILAASLRANLKYWEKIHARLCDGRGFDDEVVQPKREVETANAAVFASLQRLMADPKNRQAGLEHTAALANGNQRLTRAFSVAALQLTAGSPLVSPSHAHFAAQLSDVLTTLADVVEGRFETPDTLRACRRQLTAPASITSPPASPAESFLSADFRRLAALDSQRASITTELMALLLAAEECQSLEMFTDPDDAYLLPGDKKPS
jgi:uncharacterized membrane protein YccC